MKLVKEFSHLFKLLLLFHAGLLWFLSAVMKRYDSYYITQTGMIFYHRNICPTGYFFIWLFVSGYFWISVQSWSSILRFSLEPKTLVQHQFRVSGDCIGGPRLEVQLEYFCWSVISNIKTQHVAITFKLLNRWCSIDYNTKYTRLNSEKFQKFDFSA